MIPSLPPGSSGHENPVATWIFPRHRVTCLPGQCREGGAWERRSSMICGAPLSNRAQGTVLRTTPRGWQCMNEVWSQLMQ